MFKYVLLSIMLLGVLIAGMCALAAMMNQSSSGVGPLEHRMMFKIDLVCGDAYFHVLHPARSTHFFIESKQGELVSFTPPDGCDARFVGTDSRFYDRARYARLMNN